MRTVLLAVGIWLIFDCGILMGFWMVSRARRLSFVNLAVEVINHYIEKLYGEK